MSVTMVCQFSKGRMQTVHINVIQLFVSQCWTLESLLTHVAEVNRSDQTIYLSGCLQRQTVMEAAPGTCQPHKPVTECLKWFKCMNFFLIHSLITYTLYTVVGLALIFYIWLHCHILRSTQRRQLRWQQAEKKPSHSTDGHMKKKNPY